jgi:hypothetical protein
LSSDSTSIRLRSPPVQAPAAFVKRCKDHSSNVPHLPPWVRSTRPTAGVSRKIRHIEAPVVPSRGSASIAFGGFVLSTERRAFAPRHVSRRPDPIRSKPPRPRTPPTLPRPRRAARLIPDHPLSRVERRPIGQQMDSRVLPDDFREHVHVIAGRTVLIGHSIAHDFVSFRASLRGPSVRSTSLPQS